MPENKLGILAQALALIGDQPGSGGRDMMVRSSTGTRGSRKEETRTQKTKRHKVAHASRMRNKRH